MGYLFNPYAAYANGAAQLVSKTFFCFLVNDVVGSNYVCENELKYHYSYQTQLAHFFQISQIIHCLWWGKGDLSGAFVLIYEKKFLQSYANSASCAGTNQKRSRHFYFILSD